MIIIIIIINQWLEHVLENKIFKTKKGIVWKCNEVCLSDVLIGIAQFQIFHGRRESISACEDGFRGGSPSEEPSEVGTTLNVDPGLLTEHRPLCWFILCGWGPSSPSPFCWKGSLCDFAFDWNGSRMYWLMTWGLSGIIYCKWVAPVFNSVLPSSGDPD